jgi:DNA polymerase-3 subunit alpha
MPIFSVPDNKKPAEYFIELVYTGAKKRYPLLEKYPKLFTNGYQIVTDSPQKTANQTEEEYAHYIKQRIDYELTVIIKKKYETYFLVVSDFVNWAKNSHIAVGPGRGSAAGSVVAYVLNITDIDPFFFNLPFERFLNPLRPSAPDIDLDFADIRREEVIQYVTNKYGKDKVAQIITFGTMEARGSIRDVGRALGMPYAVPDRIAKLIPPGAQGSQMSIDLALEQAQN